MYKTKIQGLNDMVQTIFGKRVKVQATECGQKYFIYDPAQGYLGMIYIDVLEGGRVSIKLKHCPTVEADRLAKAMWNWLYYVSGITVDAASKADYYRTIHLGGTPGGMVARLRCDKWW